MQKIREVLEDKRHKLKMFEEIRKCLKSGKDPEAGSVDLRKFLKDGNMVKTLEQCQQKITKLKTQIEAEDLKATNKESNKAVALGTSKINYMDPRITIAWCKRREVPIEKIFPKTLRSKFAWAMATPSGYEF
jgi:DNA topoisomerase I